MKYNLTNNIIDCRSITADKINEVDKVIENKDYFMTQMKDKGYEEIYVNVLSKSIGEYEVNVSLTVTDVIEVDNIIVYVNNEPVDAPDDILEEVNNDIDNSLIEQPTLTQDVVEETIIEKPDVELNNQMENPFDERSL